MDVATLIANFDIKVSRYISKPTSDTQNSKSYDISWHIQNKSNLQVRKFDYTYTIPIETTTVMTKNDIINAAWSNCKPDILNWASSVDGLPSVLGKPYSPPPSESSS
jgi:hypothetical protein